MTMIMGSGECWALRLALNVWMVCGCGCVPAPLALPCQHSRLACNAVSRHYSAGLTVPCTCVQSFRIDFNQCCILQWFLLQVVGSADYAGLLPGLPDPGRDLYAQELPKALTGPTNLPGIHMA
jgi:hypothetical protein